jgi:tetratricopeptide (TPR) repeat protein
MSRPQETRAGRDAYTAGRDLTVINHYAPDTAQPQAALPTGLWANVPTRNPGFTGREDILAAIREALLAEGNTVVQALHGMGGVGKTQIAAEYAHRFADSYDLVWWIAAEQAGLIAGQFAALATDLGCARPGAGPDTLRRAVLAELRGRDRWLLLFDNAESPEDLAGWLPGGSGHVLITSRTHRWAELAVPVEVDVLARAESVMILQRRVPALSAAEANQVAEALGDLPLAVVQAASFMADTGMLARQYMDFLSARTADILDQGRPSSYPESLAAVTQLAFDDLLGDVPAAAELISICAFLAPELINPDWFTRAAARLPGPLGEHAADPLAWRQVLARVGLSMLAHVDPNGVQLHRLTQAIVRDRLAPERATAFRALAEQVLACADPGDQEDPVSWPGWARLLPHILAADHEMSRNPEFRSLVCQASWYLLMSGDTRGGHDLAERLHRRWKQQLGRDDYHTLWAANSLAVSYQIMGRFAEARRLNTDTLARRRRVLGDDDPVTLISANNLALDLYELGDYQAAREIDEDVLARRRRVLGEKHPDTLVSASNLAKDLRELGELQAARELDEDTLARRRRVLGNDHPDTLKSINNLAKDLREIGDHQAARELAEDAAARRRRVLGDDHPATLRSADHLAVILRALGQYQTARDLDEDTLVRRRQVLGDDHPDTVRSAENLAADQRALSEE